MFEVVVACAFLVMCAAAIIWLFTSMSHSLWVGLGLFVGVCAFAVAVVWSTYVIATV